MSRSVRMSPALGWAYGLGAHHHSGAKRSDPYDDIVQAALRKQRVYVVEPVVPERLRAKTELRPIEYRAWGYVRSWWGWQRTSVTIFIGDFKELSAAFHQIKNMRVWRIERADGKGAVSRDLKGMNHG